MTIGERIRIIRKEKGLTQQALGRLLGVTQATVGQYETNQNPPKIGTIEKIAAALDVDVNWLVNGLPQDLCDQSMIDYVEHRFTEAELRKRLWESYDTLTLEGKGKAVDSIEIIAGNPRYSAIQSTSTPQDCRGTTPPSDAPQQPPEGK